MARDLHPGDLRALMFDRRSRKTRNSTFEADGNSGALGLDARAADFRALLRLGMPVVLGFGLGESWLGLAYGDAVPLAGGLGLFALAGWIGLFLWPRVGREPIEGLVMRLAITVSPAVFLAGLPQPGAGTIAALVPVAIVLPYLSGERLARVAVLSLGLATSIAISSDYFPVSTALPMDLRVTLHLAGVVAAVGVVALLVAQFARRLRTTTGELAAVVAMSNDLAQTLDHREIGDLTARAVALTIGATECGVCYWDPDNDRVLTYGYFPRERRSVVDDTYDLAEYPATRRVLEDQVPLLLTEGDPGADQSEVAYLRSIGQRSMAMVPLVAKGRTLGAIEATSRFARAFDERHLQLMRTLAAEAAMALENGRLYEEVRQRAFYDSLTGLANRDLFRDRVVHALARRPSPDGPRVAVLFLDLDDFKTVNDSFGHAGGDELLGAVAARVVGVLRPADTAARLGGDEFAVLLEDVPGEAEATAVAQRLIDALRAPIRIGDAASVIATSIGIALAGPGSATADDLLRDADFAMYRAKSLGKGRFEIFRPAFREATTERTALETLLRGAVDRDELRLHYQPVVDLDDGRITGLEALLRWEAPGRGLLMPGAFIGLAEESGAIVPVGRWVLEQACRNAADWQARFDLPSLAIGVNLSARQFQHPDLVGEVKSALGASGLSPGSLVLEITESLLMVQTAATIGKLADLRRLGVRLAVDDFGTGYSSLGYLERFPVDILKIDKTFIDRLGEQRNRPVLARAIVQLGRALGLEVVAEGIERPEQARALRRLGCTRGQGYLYSRPVPVDVLEPLLREGRVRGAGDTFAERPTPIALEVTALGIA